MGLTSGGFGWITVLTSLAAFAGIVLVWPRVAGDRPVLVAARTGLLLGVNALVLLAVGVQLNDQFLFFADWSDLGSAVSAPAGPGGNPTTSTLHGGAAASQAARAHVTGAAAAPPPAALTALPRGTPVQDGVTSYQVTGALSHVTTTVLVTLPPGYDPADTATRYPVLETFHGYPGSAALWVKTMHLQAQIAAQVAAHRLRPMILVSPELEVPRGVDTECVDGAPAGSQLETFVTRDVPDWVAAHFRVNTDRSAWATIGLSAGAWCATMAAMLHPAQYGGAIVMAGYFRPDFGPRYHPFAPGSRAATRYDLPLLARTAPPPLALWIETSHKDPVSYGPSTTLLRAARPPLSITAVVLQNSGHRIGVWERLLPDALAWLGTNLPGFGPLPSP